MRNRAFRPIAAALSILFVTGVQTKAGPIVVSDVVQVLTNFQNPPDLTLRSVSQHSTAAVNSAVQPNSSETTNASSETVLDGTALADNSLLGGVAVANVDQNVGVDIIDAGDVEGTVCDCGEIPVKAGGFPLWPLLFLAAVPFFFINHDDCPDCVTPNPTPTPRPPGDITPFSVEPVPEPASLILLGSGMAALGATLRRRKVKAKLAEQIKATEEG